MIERRSIHVCLGNSNIVVQAGRLVTHSLVINSKWLSKQGVYAQGFADDGVAVVIGYFLTTLCEIMQRVLNGTERWCTEREFSAFRQS